MKTLVLGALTAAVLSLGSAPAFATGYHHVRHFNYDGAKCIGFGPFAKCSKKENGLKDLPDIFSVGPIYSTGPSSTAYGPCGNGYWSSPMPGICNIAISEDMNHGRGPTITDGGTAPTCTFTETSYFWHYEIGSHSWTKDGACKVKYHPQ